MKNFVCLQNKYIFLTSCLASTFLHFYLFQHKRNIRCFTSITYKRQTAISTKRSGIAFLHSDIPYVKTKKASHQEKTRQETKDIGRVGGGEVRDRRQGDG